MIDIEGLEGFTRWPLADSVAHVVPEDDVVLRGLPSPDCEVEIFHGDTWVTSVSVVVDGSMVLPSHLFEDAIDNRLKLVLKIRGEVYGGYIIFLPAEESEPFPNIGAISLDGSLDDSVDTSRYTDLIDVTMVREFVYSGRSSSSRASIAGYDSDGNFVKVILQGSSTIRRDIHIVPDGSFTHIRAASGPYPSNPGELILYYRSRRR